MLNLIRQTVWSVWTRNRCVRRGRRMSIETNGHQHTTCSPSKVLEEDESCRKTSAIPTAMMFRVADGGTCATNMDWLPCRLSVRNTAATHGKKNGSDMVAE
ncbi:hypothetical protein BAUCODRAFT_283707 [Baudoinia panamericana UAMH 10762]|uniref:Uncharacterized protein n=1 Tax=Baudoinia panamericana (strain UAMH 10762) TaxID=717646 RepID=M2N007_BAUPA|nr:uncharacterized protein BAUCODRAFT_283707 [Baudoinia panamericana UAMH 10762]EMC92259.1 hypothetical protein BAUCODRAFT_283707 [Baudoinia panamericana UAMH 10762]